LNRKVEENWVKYSEKPSITSYIIKRIIRLGRTFIGNKSLIQTRAMWEGHAKKLKIPSEFEIKSINISGVDCEWILPKSTEGKKTIIYLHGGGYVLGSLTTARGFALLLSQYTGERVLSVGYGLAPENPFPDALEDSLCVYHKLLEQKVSPDDIILVGDSAGGRLSLVTALALKQKEPLPGAIVCV